MDSDEYSAHVDRAYKAASVTVGISFEVRFARVMISHLSIEALTAVINNDVVNLNGNPVTWAPDWVKMCHEEYVQRMLLGESNEW